MNIPPITIPNFRLKCSISDQNGSKTISFGAAHTWGTFHSTKITGLNFRNFRWSKGTRPTASQNSKSRALQPQGMLGETLLCLKMADFLNIFAALEEGDSDCETISCTILDSNDEVILLAAVSCFMRKESTRVNGYFNQSINQSFIC